MESVTAAIGGLTDVEAALAERRAAVRANVKQRCEAIVAAVQQREAELLAECDTMSDAKASRLLEQREGLQASLEAMQAGCALARDAIERGAADPARTLYAREQLVGELKRLQAQPLVLQPQESSEVPTHLPSDGLLGTIVRFGAIGAPAAPQGLQCELQGSTVNLTWQPPESCALPITAYAIQRAVGEGAQYAAAGQLLDGGRTEFQQSVADLAGQSVRYRVQAEDERGNAGAWSEGSAIQLPETFGMQFRFQSPFDKNGVLYHIGTAGGTRTYQNPHDTGDVVASLSQIGAGRLGLFVQHEARQGKELYHRTDDSHPAWMAVDLKTYRLVPSYYALRHGRDNQMYVLRNWDLQGSDNSQSWITLRRHSNDTSLAEVAGSVAAWPLDASAVAGRSFRHFRIIMTGVDSSAHRYLHCCGIELYGTLQAA